MSTVVFVVCAAAVIALIFSPAIARKIKSWFSKEAKAVEVKAVSEVKSVEKKL